MQDLTEMEKNAGLDDQQQYEQLQPDINGTLAEGLTMWQCRCAIPTYYQRTGILIAVKRIVAELTGRNEGKGRPEVRNG
jgi:hypothetical protein